MVLAYYGDVRSQSALAAQLGVIEGVGAPASRAAGLATRKLQVVRQTGDWPDLLAALEAGIPPIVEVRTSQLPLWNEDTFHMILLTGANGDTAVVNDPAFTEPVSVSIGDLLLAWDEVGNYYTLIERAS